MRVESASVSRRRRDRRRLELEYDRYSGDTMNIDPRGRTVVPGETFAEQQYAGDFYHSWNRAQGYMTILGSMPMII